MLTASCASAEPSTTSADPAATPSAVEPDPTLDGGDDVGMNETPAEAEEDTLALFQADVAVEASLNGDLLAISVLGLDAPRLFGPAVDVTLNGFAADALPTGCVGTDTGFACELAGSLPSASGNGPPTEAVEWIVTVTTLPSASTSTADVVATSRNNPLDNDADPTNNTATVEATRTGAEIGSGSIGPPIAVPQPWPTGTTFSGFEPQVLDVDFAAPDEECIAAQANATIGRGGAILVTLFVDAERLTGPCVDGADSNQVRIQLSEPVGDRRIYTIDETNQDAEQLADSIIGLPADDAQDAIRAAGFEVRDLTGVDSAEADANPDRVNIHVSNGTIEFARVG